MTRKMSVTEKLLKEIKNRKGMTRKDMVEFLVGLNGYVYRAYEDRGNYNALLYGTSERAGVLERFCDRTEKGSKVVYTVRNPERGPFTVSR